MKLFHDESGVSLVVIILVGALLSVIGYVTVSMVILDSRMTTKHFQGIQAFWLAESGVELTSRWLRYQNPPPGGIEPFLHYDNYSAGQGVFTVSIDPEDENSNTYLKKYKIVSTGMVDEVRRSIEIELEMTTFNRYIYLTGNEGGTIWFNSGDLIEGPLHSNDVISITGSPTFMGKVTSAANSFNQGYPFLPDFQNGYQLGVPPVIFPTEQDLMNNYWAENTNPPDLIIDARLDRHSSIEFNADGTLTYSVWRMKGKKNKIFEIQDEVVNLAGLNGLIYVQGDVTIEGTLNGATTVVSTDNMYIVDDIVYEMSDSDGKPLPDCDDLLGLISLNNIIVANNASNRNDVVINAAILTLGSSFMVEDYYQGSSRGDLTIWGSLSQKIRGPVGTFSWWGTTGYQKDYHYDNRFHSQAPPYFPVTGQYHFNYWKEVNE